MFSRIMVALLILFTVMLQFGNLSGNTIQLQCQSVVGFIGQSTDISCSIMISSGFKDFQIHTVAVTKVGGSKACFTSHNNTILRNDSQFELPDKNQPSLRLKNTMLFDEGEYKYMIRTSRGQDEGKFTIIVRAKYNNPTVSSWPKNIEDGSHADLYCNASGGYPAGNIHWFDQRGTNWTKSSVLQISVGNEGLYNLSSKLSFQTIDSIWGPFKCVVLNNRYEVEGEQPFNLKLTDGPKSSKNVTSNQNQIVAAAIVIGSLIVGLLMALILTFRRRHQRIRRASAVSILRDFHHSENPTAEQQALHEPDDENRGSADLKI